ncbi:MAG: tRNA (adenosine(37)-N6)-threonylcarbamoyltransferase complex ATPase subunit type 1 TsaE [Gemmatimonadota bacterium]
MHENRTPTTPLPASPRLTESELVAWGERIGREAEPPLVIALRGDLGAGKTTLARAIARGAGVVGNIPSPTYNLMFRYDAERDRRVVHADLYRLEDESEVWAIGWSELPADDELVLIEWPERAEGRLPSPRWEITLGEGADPESRAIQIVPVGDPAAIPTPEWAG